MPAGTPEAEWREDCAPRRTLELFSTKWTSMVLHTLDARHGGSARTGVLQRSLPGISKKMLTRPCARWKGAASSAATFTAAFRPP